MITLVTLQCQPRLSSITNVALGGSANQIAVFAANKKKLKIVHDILND